MTIPEDVYVERPAPDGAPYLPSLTSGSRILPSGYTAVVDGRTWVVQWSTMHGWASPQPVWILREAASEE